MSNVLSRARTLLVVFGALGIGACASPSGPSAIPSGTQTQGAEPDRPSAGAVSAGLQVATLSEGVTDVTLVNAGWSCLEVGPGVTVCAPPGLDLPPIPPSAEGLPSYTLAAFVDHQFDHHVKFLRPDLYRGQPCLGGEPWAFLDFLNYYECIIPVRKEKDGGPTASEFDAIELGRRKTSTSHKRS